MNKLGWFAMLIIHCSTLPSVFANLLGNGALPPLSLVLMVWCGLLILFVKAIKDRDTLYAYGNGAGLLINSITLSLVIFS